MATKMVVLGAVLAIAPFTDRTRALSDHDAVIKAGQCFGWDAAVIEKLPAAFGKHPNLPVARITIGNSSIMQPTKSGCGHVGELSGAIDFAQNDTPFAMVILTNYADFTQTAYLLVDTGPGPGGAHLFIGAHHTERLDRYDKLP